MKPAPNTSASRLLIICLSICLFFPSPCCLNAQNNAPVPPKGIIVDSVSCLGDTTESYSLYLPDNYTQSAEWPVVLIFDPAARGRIALEKFIRAGKKYGYILACSNTVRNGIFSTMLSDAETMYRDVLQRFNVDEGRMFTAGFSGASRLAVGFAIHHKKISGVIGCGAGLPNSEEYRAGRMQHLLYFGIVGIEDMNYQEMTDLDRTLTEKGVPSYFLVFNGGHEWPADGNFELALGWFELKLMNNGRIEKRNDVLNDVTHQMITIGKEAEAAGDLVSAKKYYEYAIRDSPDAPAIQDIIPSIRTIEKNDSYIQSLSERRQTDSEELSNREKYERAFTDITMKQKNADSVINWWGNEIHLLTVKTEGTKSLDAFMAIRLLKMITIESIEYGKEMLSTGKFHLAARCFNIWAICEPDKKYSWYNLARAYAFDGQADRAVATLRIAVTKGFADKKMITSDPAFTFMLNDGKFIELMNGIQ